MSPKMKDGPAATHGDTARNLGVTAPPRTWGWPRPGQQPAWRGPEKQGPVLSADARGALASETV